MANKCVDCGWILKENQGPRCSRCHNGRVGKMCLAVGCNSQSNGMKFCQTCFAKMNATRHAELFAKGQCVKCAMPAVQGFTHCTKCHNEFMALRVITGKCTRCGQFKDATCTQFAFCAKCYEELRPKAIPKVVSPVATNSVAIAVSAEKIEEKPIKEEFPALKKAVKKTTKKEVVVKTYSQVVATAVPEKKTWNDVVLETTVANWADDAGCP